MEILLATTQQKENDKSSHRRCSLKKDILKNFAKFTRKYLYQSLFFNKVAGLRPATLLKKRLWQKCFPVNFANLLRTLFSQNTSRRILLKIKVIPAKQIKRFQRELCHKPCSEFQENVFQFPDVCATLRYRGNLSPNNFDKTPSYINEKSVMCFFVNCFEFLF